jgi:hypothetical protein
MMWRGQKQEFSNVYHLATVPAQTFLDEGVIDEVVRLEKTIHSTAVTFVRGRTWGPTESGDPLVSVTRTIKDVTGAGAAADSTGMYMEAAILVTWPLGRYGSKNRPQYLRKWYHTRSALGHNTDGSGLLGTPSLALKDFVLSITSVKVGAATDGYEMVTAKGREPISAGVLYKYLEHRQLGR